MGQSSLVMSDLPEQGDHRDQEARLLQDGQRGAVAGIRCGVVRLERGDGLWSCLPVVTGETGVG